MTVHSPEDVTSVYANLPFLAELRSASALSERLGFDVQPRRIRVKPGYSAIVAWQREGADRLGGFEDWGWTAVMTCEDKLANTLRRAERLGQPVTVHATADPRSAGIAEGIAGGVLLSGYVASDSKLGKHIARALELLDGSIVVIGYNPGRRVLLKHSPDSGPAEFVRIGAGSQEHLVESAAQWVDWNLPTLPVSYLGDKPTAVRSPWWGNGDLASHPDREVAEEVGVIIADLHRHSWAEAVNGELANSELAHSVHSSPLEQLEKSVQVLGRLMSESETDLTAIQREVENRVRLDRAEADHAERAIHGDLSPDQVLVNGSECRIIDLDRAGVGPIGMDLGRWVAACRNLRGTIGAAAAQGLESAFLAGYRRAGGAEIDMGAWTAWAMLVSALEPWRSCDPGWKDETKRIIAEARAALDGSDSSSADDTVAVPETVSIAGEEWRIRRAWPASRHRIALEAVREGGGIRVGFLGEDGVEMLGPGRDPKLPGLEQLLSEHGEKATIVSHRPGKRAVIRLTDGSFAKCVRPGRAAAIIAGQDRAEAFSHEFALPQVLWADDSTVVLSALPGVELHDPHRLAGHWSLAWSQALDAWSLASPSVDTSIPVHGPESEVRVLEEWRDRARDLLGQDLLAEVDSLIAELRSDLLAGASGVDADSDLDDASARESKFGPIHRDLHDKQIMWDPFAGPGLLDVDTACCGERELDLGNLRAHARWRTRQGMWNEDHAEVVLREISRATSEAGLDSDRIRVYERATLVRLACVYTFRPQWQSHVSWLLATAQKL